MKTRNTLLAITLTSIMLAAGNVSASRVSGKLPGIMGYWTDRHENTDPRAIEYDATMPLDTNGGSTNVVFETVDLFRNKTFFTEAFHIDTAGTYQVILTDFEFPKPLRKSALNITTATESLGSLFGPSSFTFDADPGLYYVSFFALAGGPGRMHREPEDYEHGRHEKYEKRDDDHGNYHRHWSPYAFGHNKWYGHGLKLGRYGIEVSLVPVPAAVWLFGSGLVGLVGLGLRKERQA